MKDCAVYIKADRNSQLDTKVVHLSDVAKIYSKDTKVADKIKKLVLYRIKDDKKQNYVFSILSAIQVIQEAYPDYLICSVGEPDFIVEYVPKVKEKKWLSWLKITIVCLVTFFGSAFTIMSFNEDAGVVSVFEKINKAVLGDKNPDGWLLEISYAVGLPIGSLVFFNHFTKAKVSTDPTPLQIQLRLNEKEIDETFIENADREGNTIDVD